MSRHIIRRHRRNRPAADTQFQLAVECLDERILLALDTFQSDTTVGSNAAEVDTSTSTSGTVRLEWGAPDTSLQSLIAEANRRWVATGLSSEQIAALGQMTYSVADLETGRLGMAEGFTITLDFDASGQGWFVDHTPTVDEEFASDGTVLRASGGRAASGVDLLTVLLHEQGHVLGLDELFTGDATADTGQLMFGLFSTGERRLPESGAAAGKIAGSLQTAEFATLWQWIGGGGDTNWSTVANWDQTGENVAPSVSGDGNWYPIVFTGSGGTANNNLTAFGGWNTDSITFAAGAGAFTISGNSLDISGSQSSTTDIARITNLSSNLQTIALPLILRGDEAQSVEIDTGAAGIRITGALSGNAPLVKTGSGTLTLASGGSANGGIIVNEGVVSLAVDKGFNQGYFQNRDDQRYTINAGGTLQIAGTWTTRSNAQYLINGGRLLFDQPSANNNFNYVNSIVFDVAPGTIDGPDGFRTGYFFNPTFVVTAAASGSVINTTLSLFDQGSVTSALTLQVADGALDADLTIAGPIDDNEFPGLNVNKTGTGTLVLNGNNTYSGTTTVGAGKLVVGGVHTGGAIIVNSGAHLGGLGTIHSLVTINGTLAPGDSLGSITFAGGVNLSGNTIFELNGASNDRVVVSGGTVNLGGELQFDVLAQPNASLITLIQNDTAVPVSGQFTIGGTLLNDGDRVEVGDRTYVIRYQGGDGNDVVLLSVEDVYVNDDWATGIAIGQDPAPGDSIPMAFGYNAFASLQEAIDAVAETSGTVHVYSGTYAGFTVSKAFAALEAFETSTNIIVNSEVTLTNSLTLFTPDAADSITFNARLTGPAGVNKIGDGTVTLNGSGNSFSGGIVIDDGTVRALGGAWASSFFANVAGRAITINDGGTLVTNTHSLGGLGAAFHQPLITVNTGGVWQLDREQYLSGNNLALNGGTVDIAAGELRLQGGTVQVGASANGSTITGNRINLFGNANFAVSDGSASTDLFITTAISQSGDRSLTKSGSGTLALMGSSIAVAEVIADGGVLSFEGSSVTSISTFLRIGDTANATVNIQDTAAVTVGSDMYLGDSNGISGSITQSGGMLSVGGNVRLGHWANETSTYDLSGGTFSVNGTLFVGWDGTGQMNVTSTGELIVNGTLVVQRNSTLSIAGSGAVNAYDVSVGDQRGIGYIAQSDGIFTVSRAFRLAHWAAGSGSSYTMSGGELTFAGAVASLGQEQSGGLYIGIDGTGTFTQSGGVVTTGFVWLDNRSATNGTDTYSLTGGTLALTNAIGIGSSHPSSMAVNLGGGTVRANVSSQLSVLATLTGIGGPTVFDTQSYSFTASGVLSGAGSVVKTGSGTLTLSGANSYAGGTLVEAGDVILRDSTSAGSGLITLGGATTGTSDVALFIGESVILNNNVTVSASGTGLATIGSTDDATLFNGLPRFAGTLSLNRPTTLYAGDIDRTDYWGNITGNVGTLTISGKRTIFNQTAKTFVGDVVIQAGGSILQLGVANTSVDQIPDTSSVTIGAGSFLYLSLPAETIGGLHGAGTVQPNSSPTTTATLTIGAGNASGTFTGNLTNQGAATRALRIVKVGTGTQVLAGGGTATGGLVVDEGIVRLEGDQPFNDGYFNGSDAQIYTVNQSGMLVLAGSWITRSNAQYFINGGTIHAENAGGDINYVNTIVFDTLPGLIEGTSGIRTGNFFDPTYRVAASASGSEISTTIALYDRDALTNQLTLDVADGSAANDLTISGNVFDRELPGLGVLKTGAGTLLLTGTNNYIGTTTIAAGLLLFDGVHSGGNYLVSQPATLGGTGTINSTIDVAGTLSPGSPTSTTAQLTTGGASFASTAIFDLQINGYVPGIEYDQLIVNGDVSLGGAMLEVLRAPHLIPTAGEEFTIILNNGTNAVSGQFAQGASIVIDGVEFEIDYAGGDGNDVVLRLIAPDVVYVDDDWAGTTIGANPTNDPIGGLVFGYNAFASMDNTNVALSAVDQVATNGTIVVYGGNYLEDVTFQESLNTVQIAVNSLDALDTEVVIQGTVSLLSDTLFETLDANLTFLAAIDGPAGLAIHGDDSVTFEAAVGATTALASFVTDAGGTLTLAGDTITTYGEIDLGNAVTIANPTFSITSQAGSIAFRDTLDGSSALANGPALGIDASGSVTFENLIGSLDQLGSFDVTADGGIELAPGTISAEGVVTFHSKVNLLADTTINTLDAVRFLSSVDGGFALVVNTSGTVSLLSDVGLIAPLASLNLTGTAGTILGAGAPTMIRTTGSQNYSAIELLGDMSLETTLDGDMNLVTIDGPGGLTMDAAGMVRLTDAIGSGSPLAALSVAADGGIQLDAGSVTTSTLHGSGDILFASPTQLASETVITSPTNVTFASSVEAASTSTESDLLISADGTIRFIGLIGSVAALESLTTEGNGTTELTTGVTTLGNQSYRNSVRIAGTQTLLGENIAFFASLDDDGQNTTTSHLSVNLYDDGSVTFDGPVGVVALDSLLVGSATQSEIALIAMNGGLIQTRGDQDYTVSVQLGTDTTLTSLASGNITLPTVNGGGFDLAMETAGKTTFLGDVNNLADLSTDAGGVAEFAAITVELSGSARLLGYVTLVGDLSVTAGGTVLFGQTIDSATGVASNLSLVANALVLGGDVGQVGPLESLVVDVASGLELAVNILTNSDIIFLIRDDGLSVIADASAVSTSGGLIFDLANRFTTTAGTMLRAARPIVIRVDLSLIDGLGATVSIDGQINSPQGVTIETGEDGDRIRYNDARDGSLSLSIDTAGGDDTVTLAGLAQSSSVTVTTGLGNDFVNVGETGHSLDALGQSSLMLDGGDQTDRLFVNDSGEVDPTAWTLGSTSLIRNGNVLIDTFVNFEDLQIVTGSGRDTVSVVGTSSQVNTALATGAGDDVVLLGGQTGVLGGVAGTLSLDLGDGSADRVIVDDSADTTDNIGQLNGGLLTGLGLETDVRLSNHDLLTILLGGGSDQFTASSSGNVILELSMGDGDDTFALAQLSTDESDIVRVMLNPGAGSDTVDFTQSQQGVSIDLDAISQQTVTARGDQFTLTEAVENFTGSIFADTIAIDPLLSIPRLVRGNDPFAIGDRDLNGNFAFGDRLFFSTLGNQGAFGTPTAGQLVAFGIGDTVLAPVTYRGIEILTVTDFVALNGLAQGASLPGLLPLGVVPVDNEAVGEAFAVETARQSADLTQFRSRGGDKASDETDGERGNRNRVPQIVILQLGDGVMQIVGRVAAETPAQLIEEIGDLKLEAGRYEIQLLWKDQEADLLLELPAGEAATDRALDELETKIEEQLLEWLEAAEASDMTVSTAMLAALGALSATRATRTNWSRMLDRFMTTYEN